MRKLFTCWEIQHGSATIPVCTEPRLAIKKGPWDKDVDVFFQLNAWADTEFVVNWAEKTMKPVVADVSYFILFLTTWKRMFMKVSEYEFPTKRELHGLEFLVPQTSGNQSMAGEILSTRYYHRFIIET